MINKISSSYLDDWKQELLDIHKRLEEGNTHLSDASDQLKKRLDAIQENTRQKLKEVQNTGIAEPSKAPSKPTINNIQKAQTKIPKALKYTAGTAGAIAAIYGAKKLYDKYHTTS